MMLRCLVIPHGIWVEQEDEMRQLYGSIRGMVKR